MEELNQAILQKYIKYKASSEEVGWVDSDLGEAEWESGWAAQRGKHRSRRAVSGTNHFLCLLVSCDEGIHEPWRRAPPHLGICADLLESGQAADVFCRDASTPDIQL